jgi:hypothetical protein
MMLVGCKCGSSLLVTLVDRCAWCWSAADMRCLATRELLGEIPGVGSPKPFTSGDEWRQ